MSYDNHYYNRVIFDGDLNNGISLHMHCPVCGINHSLRHWEDINTGKFIDNLPENWDFNGTHTFTISAHDDMATNRRCSGSNAKIKLYIAVHKIGTSANFILSVEPIPSNWYEDLEVEL